MIRYDHRPDPEFGARGFSTDSSRPTQMLAHFPNYAPTPLRDAPALARELAVARLLVQDESTRMGLGSFKGLGGGFALAQMICTAAGTSDPSSPAAQKAAAEMTFVTASAGNHGLSVSSAARTFGAAAEIILPDAAPEAFAHRIKALGANVRRGGTYEESVALAMKLAEDNQWFHLADGSWEGYTDRPSLIVEGYSVLAEECRTEIKAGGHWPSHVFLQAGVGGLAASLAAHIRDYWETQPEIIIVEPDAAPCLLRSVEANALMHTDGPVSNMGRLDCKDASLINFQGLRRDANTFLTISDNAAQEAADLLGRHAFPTTPSGAAGLAGLIAYAPPADATCMIVVSEGPEDV